MLKFLKCEFQKTSNFDLTCWKRMHFFRTQTENESTWRPCNPKFFGPKNSMKIHEFFISNSPYYKKKLSKKEFFQNHPYVIRKWFFGFLKKTDFFLIFLFKFTLLLKKFFFTFFFFLKNFENFWKIKVPHAPATPNFFDIFWFWWKTCFQSGVDIFFR